MPYPQLFISSTLRDLRLAILQRTCSDMAQLPLVFVPGFGAVRGWRQLAHSNAERSCLLPRFAVTGDWFQEAALVCAPEPLRFITAAQRRLVLRALLENISPQLEKLSTLAPSTQFLQQLDRWMSQLFSAGVTDWPQDGGPWSKDLQFILRQYRQWQQQHDDAWCDEEQAPHLYARFAANHPAPPRHVVVEGAVTLTPNERHGMNALIAQCTQFTAALVVPGISAERANWSALLEYTRDSVLEKSLRFWKEQQAELHLVGNNPSSTAKRMHDLPSLIGAKTRLHFHAAHTPWHEVRQTAQAIRARATDMRQAAECGVILTNNGAYLDIVKSTFDAHGLPLQRLPRQALSHSPLIQKLMQLLNLPRQQWRINALIDVFSGDSLRWKCGEHILHIKRLEQLAGLTRQHSLKDLSIISGLLASGLPLRDVDINLIHHDINALSQLQERLQAIEKAATPQTWTELVDTLWDDLTTHWTDEESPQYAARARLQIADAKMALTSFRRSCAWWEKYFSGNAAIWQSQLSLLLSDASQGGPSGVTSGINITSPRQLEQNVPDVIYWTGLTERDYPQSTRDALQARHQKTLQRLCPHLPSSTAQSIYWLALALGEASEIHFSWPSFLDGRSLQPTMLLENIPHADAMSLVQPDQKYFSRASWLQNLAHSAKTNPNALLPSEDILINASLKMYTHRNAISLNNYDGSLSNGEALMQTLWQQRNQRLELSASSLQTYAECGLKYFFKYILALKTRAENYLLLQKNETGSLIHAILEQFYRQFTHSLAEQYQAAAWQLLCQIATAEVAKLPISKALQQLELRRLIVDGGPTPGGVLGKYLLSEIELRKDWEKSDFATAMQPFGRSSLQLPEGLSRAYEGRFKLQMGDVLLDGKIDRLDAGADGNSVLAVDYKTGSIPPSKTAPDGISFQLPLYMWALQQLFGAQGLAIGGIFYSLKDYKYTAGIARGGVLKKRGNYNASPRPLSEEEWAEFNNTLTQQIQEIHHLIRRGQFPISARSAKEAKCEYCDYRNICYRNNQLQEERLPAFINSDLIYLEGLTPDASVVAKEVE